MTTIIVLALFLGAYAGLAVVGKSLLDFIHTVKTTFRA